MTDARRSDMAQATPEFSGVEVANSTGSLSAERAVFLRRLAEPEGGVLTDIGISKLLAKAIGARRETQRYLERLTRQIVSRAGRQATTVKTRSRNRRRSGPRIYYQELVDRLTYERWAELDVIACNLAMQEPVKSELQLRDTTCTSSGDKGEPGPKQPVLELLAFDVSGMEGLVHIRSFPLETDIGPVSDCPSCCCGLNRRPGVSRPLSRRGAADPASLRESRLAVPSRSKPAGPQTCPACSAGSDL